jgi:hypothetical protein
MTVRGCVVGNSHVGALRLGWQVIKDDYPTVDMTFFASPRQRLRKTFVRRGILATKDETVAENLRLTGGSETIDLRAYDFLCICGCGINSRMLLQMQAGHIPFGGTHAGEMVISEAYLRECYAASLGRSTSRHLLDIISAATKASVYVVPDPHLANAPEALEKYLDYVMTVQERGGFALSRSIFMESIEAVFADAKKVLFQVPETLDGPLLSRMEFARGPGFMAIEPERDDGEDDIQSVNDIVHLNADYGVLFWKKFFSENAWI